MITLETLIRDESLFPVLEQCASLFPRLERLLFRALYVENEKPAEAKRRFISEHGITARQFNAVHRQLEGKVKSWCEAKKHQLVTLGRQIKRIQGQIKKFQRKNASAKSAFEIHQKKRRLQLLLDRRSGVERELAAQVPSICFGSKALFQEQFYLKENGHVDHAAWKREWQAKRASSFFVLGSADETSGNQTCKYRDGALHLRLPDALGGEAVAIPVSFRHREQDFLLALTPVQQELSRGPRKGTAIERCSAVSYRFIRCDDQWYVHAMFEVAPAPVTTDLRLGCVGIDLNAWGLAVTRNDSSGNPVDGFDSTWSVRGRTQKQIKAAIGDGVRDAVLYAKRHRVPIAKERLDFSAKKAENRGPGANRMLSAFAYGAFDQMIRGRCAREGVELIGVNPALTTVIGRGKFARGYGLSGHRAAACAIARRAQHFGERLRTRSARSALGLPARNRSRHVWHDWGRWGKSQRPRRSRLSKPKGSPGSKPAGDRRVSSDPVPPNERTANARTGIVTPRTNAAFAQSGAIPEVNGRRHCSGGLNRSTSPPAHSGR